MIIVIDTITPINSFICTNKQSIIDKLSISRPTVCKYLDSDKLYNNRYLLMNKDIIKSLHKGKF